MRKQLSFVSDLFGYIFKKPITWPAALIVIVLTIFAVAAILPHLSGNTRAKAPMIYSNLRQLEIAKQMWADDHGKSGAVQVTKQDLAPYFDKSSQQHSSLVSQVICERYVINSLGVAPEAVLTQDWKTWPKGMVFKLHPMRIIPPNTALEPTPHSRHGLGE